MSALPSEADFPSEQSHLQEVIDHNFPEDQRVKVSLDLLYRRYRGICWICRRFCPRDKASRDHIIPRSLGGTNDISNLALAHKLCNSKRGNGYNEILFKSYADFDGDKDVVILKEHGVIFQIVFKEEGVAVILSKKREDWDNGNYRQARARI